ncbi:MAG: pilus assembly protein PilP [Oligoflexia bacterium]|nr:pilus assembly protein PilP [Oligoflexia bacterium]
MAQGNRRTIIKNAITIGAVLAAIQIGIVAYYKSTSKKVPIRQAINERVDAMKDLPAPMREMRRIQLALNDYKMNNGGKIPADLKQLIPTYFDSVPNDPSTGKPFEYRVEGTRYLLGNAATKERGAAAGSGANKRGEGGVDLGTVTEEEKKMLLASLDQNAPVEKFNYDPSQKKDPFRPFDVAPDVQISGDKPPLQRYNVEQFKMTAVLESEGQPSAMIEDPSGHGYSVKKGTKVGQRDGEVIDIMADRVVVLETEVDFTGEKRTRTIDILMKGPG